MSIGQLNRMKIISKWATRNACILICLPDRIPKPIFQYCEKEYLETVFHQQYLTIHLYLQVGEGV